MQVIDPSLSSGQSTGESATINPHLPPYAARTPASVLYVGASSHRTAAISFRAGDALLKSNRSGMTVVQLRREIEELHKQLGLIASQHNENNDSRIKKATTDPFTWVTQFTKTYNEHWIEEGRSDPYEHFPPYDYIRHTFELLELERVHWFEKSRDMMLSWSLVAYLTLQAMRTPFRGVLFQTQKEDKVIQLIKYAKCLYRTQPEWLQEAFPLAKPIEKQADLELEFANGSYIAGIPGGADQIRSYHPWGYLNDESSFQPEAGECYNEALAVVKGKIIFNSSAGPGWYADARHDIVRNQED